jgi:hypothetical protein
MRSETELKVCCEIGGNLYPKGVKVSNREMAELNIKGNAFHAEWNYTISPNHALGAVHLPQVRQSETLEMGDAEVQALQSSQNPGWSLPTKSGPRECEPLRALADQHVWYVCLMGVG